MNLSENQPSIKLGYRPPQHDRTGPSTSQVFAGLLCFTLGLAPLGAGLAFVWLTAGDLLRFKRFGDAPFAIGLVCGAAVCFFAAFVMFRMSHRMFTGKRNGIEGRVVENRLRPATNADSAAVKAMIFGVLIEYGLKPDPACTDADLDDLEGNYAK